VTNGVDYSPWLASSVAANTPPDASLDITPDPSVPQPPGTVYTLDASDSTDYQDHPMFLEVCWDWDNNGSCDTAWSSTKITTHSFSGGLHTMRLVVRDSDGSTDETTQDILATSPPTATYTYTQTTWAEVEFDASDSEDEETPKAQLKAYWDWEGDSVLDTGAFSVTQVVSHTYSHLGRYWPTLAVVDTDNITGTMSKPVDIIPPAVFTDVTGSGGTLLSQDMSVQTDMYTDTVVGCDVISNGLVVTHTGWLTVPFPGLPGDFTYQGFNLAATSLVDGQPITEVCGTYTITVFYPFSYFTDVLDLFSFEGQLKLYWWSGTSWELVDFALDTASDQLVATTPYFGDFALAMDVKTHRLPLVMRNP
jgi:hypothetical protein